MAICDNIEISKEQTYIILQNIYSMLLSSYSPHTIVDYVCSELGTPQVNETNYCVIACVSSYIFRYASYSTTSPTLYTYKNINTTYTYVTGCFPEFASSECSGGNSSSSGRGCGAATQNCKDKQNKNMDKLNDACIKSLTNQLSLCFTNISITCSSYAMYLSMLAEHLSEITYSDITKRIGAAIDWIAKIWKSVKDMMNSIVNWSKTAGESDPSGHFRKAIQDALTTLQGYLTDIMKNAGQYIEQIGEFLYDMTDRIWDLKDIAFNLRSLASMIQDMYFVVTNIINRQTLSVNNSNIIKTQIGAIYDAQFSFVDGLDVGIRAAADASEHGINNLSKPHVDVFFSLPTNVTAGGAIS